MDFEKTVLTKLDRIEAKQIEHTIELVRNTVVLNEHHVRTSNLENRFKPVENHVLVVNGFVKIGLAVVAATASLTGIYHYFFK